MLIQDYSFEPLNFKSALINEVTEMFPDTLEEMSALLDMSVEQLFSVKPPLMRRFLQNYGTDVRRAEDQDYWVNRWEDSALSNPGKNFVADDVRFQNEFDKIQSMGGAVIRVVRDDISTGGEHVSETEHLNFAQDFTVSASVGALDHIKTQVDSIMETIKSNTD